MLEAASIDGATKWQILLRIIIPCIKMTIINLVLLTYILCITFFDYSYLLGGVNGGLDGNFDVMALSFYRTAFGSTSMTMGGGINKNSMGMGATIATTLFFIILIMVAIQLRISYKPGKKDT